VALVYPAQALLFFFLHFVHFTLMSIVFMSRVRQQNATPPRNTTTVGNRLYGIHQNPMQPPKGLWRICILHPCECKTLRMSQSVCNVDHTNPILYGSRSAEFTVPLHVDGHEKNHNSRKGTALHTCIHLLHQHWRPAGFKILTCQAATNEKYVQCNAS
jgi:hypothetical protein